MSNQYLIYRVSDTGALAEQLVELEQAWSSSADFADCVQIEHPSFQLPTVKGALATTAQVGAVRTAILGELRELESASEDQADIALSTALYENLKLLPAQAGDPLFWQTMTSFVLPEVVMSRFGDSDNFPRERFLSGRRNALSRLWFRRQALPLELEVRYQDLLRQDLVQQIVERPSLASDQRFVALGLELIRERGAMSPRIRDFYREALKEMTLLAGVVVVQAMPDRALHDELARRFDRVLARLGARN